MVDHAEQYINIFKNTMCSDEFIIQTILRESPFYDNVHQAIVDDRCHMNMRLIVWEKGMHPKVLNDEDAELIYNTDLLFARKFDCTKNKAFVSDLVNRITENSRKRQ